MFKYFQNNFCFQLPSGSGGGGVFDDLKHVSERIQEYLKIEVNGHITRKLDESGLVNL